MIRVLPFLVLLASCSTTAHGPRPTPPPRNVILMIGDGMGVSQITLARKLAGPLAMDEFPVTGLMHTHSADAWVTDSGAAATAMACGVKTKNLSIGLDADGKKVQSILEDARDHGLATGMVTTSKITHATPAAFAAHVDHRHKEELIARQYKDAKIDVLIGGGRKYFSKELWERLEEQGSYVQLSSEGHTPFVLDRRENHATLASMTLDALRILKKKPRGFFLMVEGARIDHACHASDAAGALAETKDFDNAVRAVHDFARQDENTLVIVTADHATGGMAITRHLEHRRELFARVKSSVLAMAAKVKLGSPLQKVLRVDAGITDVTAEEEEFFARQKGQYDPATAIGEIISKRLGVLFMPLEYWKGKTDNITAHVGAQVPLYAFGPGSERFTGTLDNTDIAKRIRLLTGW